MTSCHKPPFVIHWLMCTFEKESLIALQLEKEFWKTIYEHAYISLYWYILTKYTMAFLWSVAQICAGIQVAGPTLDKEKIYNILPGGIMAAWVVNWQHCIKLQLYLHSCPRYCSRLFVILSMEIRLFQNKSWFGNIYDLLT